MRGRFLLFFVFLNSFSGLQIQAQESFFSEVKLSTDTASYNSLNNIIQVNNENRLCFYYSEERQVVEVKLTPKYQGYSYSINKSRDFEIIDSLLKIGDLYRFKVRFVNLNSSDLLRFSFNVEKDSAVSVEEVLLQPLSITTVDIGNPDDELFIGEEKTFELFSNNIDNINASGKWESTVNFDYRLSRDNSRVYLHLVPKELGVQKFESTLRTGKPYLNSDNQPVYETSLLSCTFNVKSSRLQFLSLDKKEVTLSEETRKGGIEVQINNSRMLDMNKTYRIEGQEEKGGALIAELFTKQRLGNNRILCILRPYNFHRNSEGYLYIKDGDNPRFITNFSITPATKIEDILILREGNVWQSTTKIYPGQIFDLKLVGEGMHKARFYFEDLEVVVADSLVKSENQQVFRLKVPVNISKKTINIYNHSQLTGKALKVSEFQKPREFDYMYLDYGTMARKVSGIKEPIFYQGVVKDMVLSFNESHIDGKELFGKQYIDIDVRISGRKNELVELKRIENIAVCPSGKSPRSEYYKKNDCFNGDLSLNKYLKVETSSLEGWSRINLTVSNSSNKYSEKGYEKELEVILKRRYSFDIELSFPAGLITISKQDNDSLGFGSLSGISLAMIGQFSFYHPEKINQYRPYKIGAGFLALNAFNFSDNVDNRDVGLVIIGSLYPSTKDRKLAFPLYVGGGYFLKDQKFFFLIGPGIRIRL